MTDCCCRRGLPHFARQALLVPLLLALLLVGALSLFPAGPAHAQEEIEPLLPTITIHPDLPSGAEAAPQGALSAFEIRRTGNTSDEVVVRLETVEPQRQVGFGSNPTTTQRQVRMAPGETRATLLVPTVGSTNDSNHGWIRAVVQGHSTYDQGQSREANVTIRAAVVDDVIVSIAASVSTIAEGDNAEFTLTRTGDTASTLTVTVRVEDPGQAMRGNHWDPATEAGDFSHDVTFAAGAATATVSLATRPNIRDTGDLTLTAEVQPDDEDSYWLGNTFAADVTVTDDDTAAEFSLSVSPAAINEGEDVTFTLTRHGDVSQALEEVPFVLRIGADYRRYLWPDSVEPQDYGAAMDAGRSTRDYSFTVHLDGGRHGAVDFRFEAEFKPADGIPEAHQAEYFTVRGDREVAALVHNVNRQQVWFASIGNQTFDRNDSGRSVNSHNRFEGQEVPFVIARTGSAEQIAEELVVQVRYFEIDHPYRRGSHVRPGTYYNPSDQRMFMTFPAGETRVSGSYVHAVDDVAGNEDNGFSLYFPRFPYAEYWSWADDPQSSLSAFGGIFWDNPRAISIALAEDDSDTIEEGETAEFVLTRGGSTDQSLTLDVAIDDPGDFRRGNHWMHTPDRTVAVTFDAGSSTSTLSVPTSDDWRDIPDNTITATIPPSQDGSYRPAYETEGETSAAVTVEDNDVAPKITLTASATTVVEGEAASFTLTRDDTDNRLHIPYEFGVQGEEQFQTYLWAETKSRITLDVDTEDDDYDGPDEIVYAFSMVSLFHVPQDELNQYWTIEGPSSATITVTDNDLPLVGVDEVEQSYRENGHGQVRFVRDGQTGDELELNFIITQDGNSLYLTEQIGHELTIYIPAGEESSLTSHLLAWSDGDEDDTTLTVTAVAHPDRYRIDPERASATFTVTDRDPLPVLSISDATASEGDGTIDFQVSIDSTVSPPSRREIGVIHYTQSGSAEPGEDYTGTSKFLTIPPLATSFTISIPLLDDGLVEEEESFTLKLNFPINVRLQDGQGTLSATGTITDNEPTVSVSAVSDEVDEGDTAVLEFVRTGSTAEALTVYFSHIYELSPGGARVVHTTQSLEIPAGQASAQLSIETEDDGLDTVDRVFGISVVPPTWEGLTAYYRQDPATAWVTIKDTDLPVVSVEADSEGVHESYDADFTLTRVGRTDIALTVNVTVTQEGSFLPSGDPPSTVTFAEGSETATLTLATVGDSTLEDHGSVTVAVAEGDDYEVGLPASATTAVADNDRDGVSVSIAGENAAVDEGEDVVFTVTRSGGEELAGLTVRVIVREVNFGIDLRNSKNTKGKQYDVQFAAGSATATLTIATRDESYNDGNSYLWADLPLSASYGVDPFPGRAQVWVRDDDIPTVHVTPEKLTVVEDGINIPRRTFHRTGDTSQTLWLDVDVYSLQRRASGDERSPREGLQTVRSSIDRRSPSSLRLFGLNRHAPIDGTESYVLLPSYYCETVPGDCGTRPQYRVGSPSSSFITMVNSAQGVRIEADRETVTEGEAATFTLTRHGSTSNARGYILGVRVGVTQDGQFIDGVPPQTVTFRGHPVIDHSISSLTATLTIPTIDDDVHEAGGSIEVVILPSTGIPLVGDFIYEPSSPASASVTVADNDPPAVAVSDASASEDAGTMQFTVSVPAAYGRLTVDWETSDGSGDDAATAGSDYEAASGQVVFNDGEAERTISVNITDDNDEEGNETFTVTLKNPVGLALPADPTATGTILDDDGSAGGPMIGELPSGVDVTITAAESSVEEGAAAAFTITRRLGSGAQSGSSSDDPLNVSLALSQEGDFFSPSSKNFSGATVSYDAGAATVDVTIPAGQLSVTLNLTTDDDEVAEADGSITLTVAEGTDYEVGFPAIATTNVTDNDVGISISDVTQSEDKGEMTFTVSLSRSAGEAVTVVASTMDGTATSDAAVTATSLGKDFEAKTETLTISAGDTEAEFTVTLLDDTIDEDAEEFTVTLSSPSDNAVLLDESATGAIEDNDDPMMVGVHREGRTVNENAEGPVVFRFQTAPQADSATTATERAITVRWTVLPGTATAGEDYVAVAKAGKTGIPVGLTTRSVEVTLTDDSLFEAIEETFTFEIKGAVNAVKNTNHESIEMSILDDEGMRADVLPVSPVVAEGEDAVFTVFLTESVSIAPVKIIYSVVGTAGPSDYVAPSGTLIIPAGETSGAITIATVADEIADGDETLGVLLTRATMKAREVITPEEQHLVTILDANTLSASFVSGASAEEGKAVEFTVRLSTASDQTVRVTWETEDVKGREAPATANVDYTSSTGTVEILAGDTSAAFTVDTIKDSLYEGDEVFGAKLIDAVRVENDDSVVAIPLGTSSLVGAILDDDAQPTDIKLTATPATVDEGAGETEFTVTGTLTGSTLLTGDVEIALNLEGSVSENEDVDDTEPATLTISAGQASGTTTISATPLDDEVDDDGASIRITGTSDGFDVAQAVVTVIDDDDAPSGVTLSLSQNTIGEGDGETELTVTATLTGGGLRTEDTQVVLSVEGVSIPSTVEGEDPSVTAGSDDFTAPAVTLTIPARQRSGTATVAITPVDDNLTEGPETARISGENDDLDVTPARLTIEDNDQDATGIRLSVSPASVTEKDGAEEIEVTATLTGGGVRMTATTVVLTVADVSATTGIDYTADSTNLVIPSGQLSGAANVSINLIDDDLDEPIKRVAIRGTNDDPGLPVRGARVSINDDDLPPTGIVLSVNRSTVQENLGLQTVQVTAEIQGNRRSTKTVVTLATAGGTAIHSTDYRPSQGLLTIPAGARTGSAPFLVEPIDDQLDEDDETLSIGGSPSLRSLNVQSAVITITDDDTAGVAITPNALSIDEGNSGSYRVALQTQPSQQVTVTVTGEAGTDLTLDKTTLTFTASNWGTPQALTVTAGDDADGADDSVTLTHTAAGGEYADVAADLPVTVVDDDTASVVLSETALSVGEEDATGASYTVKLGAQPSETVTVTVSGQAGTDLTLTGLSATSTLTFTTDTWDTAQTVTVKAGHDADGSDDTATLTHTAAGGEYADVAADLPVTVVDDDTASVVLTPTTLSVDEGDATGATYTVKLATQPSAEVTVTVTGQANTDLTLTGLSGTGTLTFTASNWNTAQTVTVTAAEDDDGADGSVTLTHTAAGGEYEDVTADLEVTVDDDETVSVVLSETALSVDEGDATGAAYTVKLATQPSETVTVAVSGHTGTDVSVDKASLTFTIDNWDTPQTVTATAAEDADGADDSVTLTHTAAGGEYEDVTADLEVTVDDDETVSVVLSETALSVDEEDATGASYTVKLGAQPSETVTVTVSGQAGTDLTLTGLSATSTLTFTTDTWDTAQTVTVKAGDDADGADDSVTLTHTAAGGEYEGATADLPVTVVDDDRAIVLSATSITVDEGDVEGETYTVTLATQPSVEVTVTVTGHSGTNVSVDKASLIFTTDNWDTAQTVTVTAADDADGADDAATLTHTAAGGAYAGATADLSVTVVDDDRGIVLSPTSLTVDEGDDTGATYTVKLATQPSAEVTVAISGHTGTDVSLDKASLTFTTGNWDTAQTVTVKAVQDADGADDAVTLTHTATGGNYDGETADLAVTVDDDETVALVLSESTLSVNEEDATGASYNVKLGAQPSENVTVTVTGQANTDLTLTGLSSTNTMTFTASTWNTAQTVTVTAADDADGADDAETLTHTAAGGEYAGVTADLAVTVVDDDRGIVLSPASLSVGEGDATGAAYTVKLATQPSETVTVAVSGHTGTDLTLDKASLTFTTDNWNTAQTVTVTAADDDDGADDSVTLTHMATGGEYTGETATLPVTVVDDDRAIVLTPTSLSVDEGGATGATYTVKLATQPSAEVTVTVSGHTGTDLSVDQASLTFTTGNWDTAQTVTVTAGQDADGADDTATLTHTAAGGNYAGVTADLAVTVDDDETVSVVLSKSALSVDEGDTTGADYTVKLSHAPAQAVTVGVTGHSGTDLSLDKTTLTFTASNWDTAQTVKVTAGQDDDGSDDTATLTHTAAGGNYAGMTATLPVTVVDDDRGIVLSATSITVGEGDAVGVFYTVKLATQPSAEVTVAISGHTGTDVSVDKASLTFTTSNWDTAQTVTVTAAEDDDGSDDTVTLTHTAAGGNYAGVTADLAVTVVDDETVSVVLSESALSVDEGDTTGADYTVRLSHQPSENVTVTVTGHSGTDLGLDKTTLTFSPSNWNTAQTVTVTAGQDDDGVDDEETLRHTAAGGEYASVTATLPVTVVDDDRGIVLSPMSLTVDEGDDTGATYTVKLATQPSAEVTVAISGHTGTDVSVDKASLTFTTGNWNTAQTVTVTAADDDDGADDTATLTHTATGGNYAGVTADLAVTVDDDETVSVALSKSALSVDEGDTTGADYTVRLSHQPSENVTVTVTGHSGTDLGLDKTTLTFSPSNWNTAQTVKVTAAQDADGADDSVTLTHTAAGGEYASVTAALPVTVVDDDRGIVLSRTSLSVDEGDTTGATYTVKLATQPSAEVTVTISGQTGTDLTLDKSTLTFTTDTWNTAQTVKVTAAEDTDVADDSITLTHTGTGGNYTGETADLSVTVDDDETVSLVLSESSLSVDEGDTTGSDYTIKLSHRPSENVTVTVTGHSGTDVSLDKASLTFTGSNWNTAQTVTVTAGHDDDGADDTATLTHTAAGGEYASVTADLPVTVVDDDRAIVLSRTSLSVDEGDATGVSYTVKLATQPSAEVTVAISGHTGTDLGLDKTTLTFTTSNWNTAQTVKVTAGQDADGSDDTATLTHTATGGNYAGVTADLAVTVDDDETVSVTLSESALSVDEGDTTGADYTVRLSHQPSENVTVTVTGHSGTDLGLDKTTLTFSPSNWNTAQTVKVTAAQDADGADDSVTLTHTAAGGEYASVTAALPVTVVDDDRGIVLSRTSLSVDEGDTTGATYTVKLATQPSQAVAVTVTGHSGSDLSLDKTTLTFTTGNWDTAQTVKVTAAQDDDGSDDTATLTHTATGGNYAGVTADLTVTVIDDETVSVALSESALSVDEGDTTGADYTVRLSHQPSENVTVTVTGHSGSDLTLTGLSATDALTFTASNWNTAQTVTVTAADDDDGTDDSVTLTHTAAGGEYAGAAADLAVKVIDDDRAIVLSRTSLSVDEGDTTGATYTVKLATQPSAQVTVAISGHTGTDLSLDKASLTFTTSNWDTAQTVKVTAGHDLDGGDDTVTLTHTAAGGEYADVTADLPVTVIDDDKSLQTSATVSFANTGTSIPEGATTTVSVQLSQSMSEAITVGLTTTNQSGATNADYSGVPASLEFASGETIKSFTFVAETDLVDELDEEVVIGFGTLPEGLGAGADNQATITIRDATSITISFDSGTYSATEGGSDATVTVELSATPAQQVEITLTATGHDGATSGDWSGVPSSLTFDPGDTSKSFTVTAVDDTVEDDGEMVELGFGALPEGFVDGANATARVTLMNDDQTVTCDDADQYTEDDVEVSVANNGKSLPDQAANTKGYVPVLEVGQTLEGYIAPCFDWDLFGFELEEGKYYRLDYLGASSLDGTLRSPNILALFNDGPRSSSYRTEAEPVWYRYSDGKRKVGLRDADNRDAGTIWVDPGAEFQDNWDPMTQGNAGGGLGRNARQYLMHFPAGMYYALLIGDGYKIGTYRIRLTEVSDDDSGIRTLTLENQATGSLDYVGDEDVFELDLVAGKTYKITIQKKGPSWKRTSTSPFFSTVEDVDASTVTSFPFLGVTSMREISFTAATTGVHRFTIEGYTVGTSTYFADGEYGLTVTELIPVPSAPQNLKVSSLTHDSVTLTWEAPEDSVVESYQILRRSLDDQEYGDGYGSTKFVVVADEIGSGETSYTDTSVEPRTRYVYRMKAGNERGLSERSNYVNADTPAENSAATGAPTISGTVQVGETLTVDTSGIDDADGLNDVSYSYQWLAGDMEIADATNASYTLGAGDQGKSIKVRVDFTDDAGHQESLTSQPVGPVDHQVSQQRINSPPNGAPTISGTVQVEETLTADVTGIADEDGLNEVSYSYQWLADDAEITDATGASLELTDDQEGKAIKVKVSFTDDNGNPESLTSAATAAVAPPPNSPATGQPTIGGTAQVEETLMADVTGIADEDGLDDATFAYQWVRSDGNDGTDEEDIQDATGSTYNLTEDDVGKSIRVRVDFTDDAGHQESLTSQPVGPVDHQVSQQRINSPPNGAPTISGTVQVEETLTADVTGIADEDGLDDATFAYQWVRSDGSDEEDIQDATGSTYNLTEDDVGKTIRVRVDFTDDAGYQESLTSQPVGPVDHQVSQQRSNSSPTGAPTISGTVKVEETLTVDTTGIDDADGLNDVSYSYQWLADDTDVKGATASSYMLTDAEEGKTIKVRVSFTDDAGNEESLTSGATDVVEPAGPTEPPPAPQDLTATVNEDGSITLSWSAPNDDSVTGYQILRRRPGESEDTLLLRVENTGGTATAFTDTDVEVGKLYVYRVKAINEAGVGEQSNYVNVDT